MSSTTPPSLALPSGSPKNRKSRSPAAVRNVIPLPTVTEVANTALDICERELQECRDTPTFADADGDGEHDFTDECPSTPTGDQVDQAGCSVEQFCARFDVSTGYGRASCNNADWKNNQPVGNPQNCKATQTKCVPQRGACGLGFELVLVLPALMWLSQRPRRMVQHTPHL